MSTGPHPALSISTVSVHLRGVAAGVLAVMLWCALMLLAPPAVAAPADEPEPGRDVPELHVELTEISPAVLRPGEDLTIRGTVQNVSAEVVSNVSVELIMQRHALSSRTAVQAWHSGTSSSRIGTATPVVEDLEEDLEPGASIPFRLTMPSGPTFAESSPWGPRGIEVEASGVNGTGWARSLLLWFPEESPLAAPAELSVLVPLTATVTEWRQAITDDVPVGQVAAGRLLPLIHEMDDDVAWAIDPALLEDQPVVPASPEQWEAAGSTTSGQTDGGDPPAAPGQDPGSTPDVEGDDGAATEPEEDRNGGTDPPHGGSTTDDGSGRADPGAGLDATAQDDGLHEVLAERAASRDVVRLGYADADLAAMAHAGDLSLWRLGEERGARLLEQAGLEPLAGVHWPAGAVDGATLDALAGEGVQTALIPERILADQPAAPGTGPALVRTRSGPVDAVVPDARASMLVAGVDAAGEDLDPLLGRQLMLADSAAAVRERQRGHPGFLLTFPRDASADHVTDNLAELTDAPWLETASMRSLLGRGPGTERTVERAVVRDTDRLPAQAIADLESQHAAVRNLSQVLGTSQPLLDQVEPAVLTSLSAAWSGHTGSRDDLLNRVDGLVEQVTGSVRIETGSSVLLINHSGDLPVAVANDLPVEARVTVALHPQDPRLRAGDPVETVLDPQSITTVRVPIEAVANGNVDLTVHILDEPGGDDVGRSASFMVRVRADWEDIGTAVVAGLLSVGFVIGMVRTIRSGRRRFAPGAPNHAAPDGKVRR